MAEVVEIPATARPRAGKGAARAVRRQGKIPAVIYGEKQEPETIALDANELWKVVQKGRFLSTVLDINVDGQKRRVLPREVQLDPVKDLPLHVDFQRVGASDYVRVVVPVRFINEGASPGLKRGGVLNVVRHEVEVTCPPDRIPEALIVDLTGLEIGRSIHISAVPLGEGVRPTITNRDFTVATIAGKKTDEDRAAEAAEGAEAEKK
ncbi:MAG TPA: 50S ribosomal protein L25/general stress protein Ctc [Hyphomicrobiaceae bacterium]|jgi:large subunit ribosomal protein L25